MNLLTPYSFYLSLHDYFGSRVVIAEGAASHDNLPLHIKCSHTAHVLIASDNQDQLLTCSYGLVSKPDEPASTDRRRGKGVFLRP